MRNGEDWTQREWEKAESILGYKFKDKELLIACFTHSTYSNIHSVKNNERLEFMGDSVIQQYVTEKLYKKYPNKTVKELSAIRQRYVSKEALEAATNRAGLMALLRYSGGKENIGGKPASDLFEAVVAGLYFDGGMAPVQAFLKKYLSEDDTVNYKTLLQEYVQAKIKQLPKYSKEQEPESGKYRCTVTALGRAGEGTGASIKEAETAAAEALYHILTKGNRQ